MEELNNIGDEFGKLDKFLSEMMRKLRKARTTNWDDTVYRNGRVELPRRSWGYWMGLPAYAHMYIKPAYNGVCDTETLVNFLDHFLGEYMETENEQKRLCIEAVVFPVYKDWTGRNFDANLIAL